MPEITSIKPQKNGKRVNIYLDGKFGFGIDLENFVILGFKEGDFYDDDEIQKIIKKASFQKTLDKLTRFTSLRPRSKNEVYLWLRKKKIHESLYNDLLKKLENFDLLDDLEFARWWIEQRMSFRPRGKKALRFELLQKGVDKKIIDKVFVETNFNEEKMARKLLERNSYKWEKYTGLERRQKKTNFLARKGFSWEVINKIL